MPEPCIMIKKYLAGNILPLLRNMNIMQKNMLFFVKGYDKKVFKNFLVIRNNFLSQKKIHLENRKYILTERQK